MGDFARKADGRRVFTADFSLGCYCAEESRCHHSVLKELLARHGAMLA